MQLRYQITPHHGSYTMLLWQGGGSNGVETVSLPLVWNSRGDLTPSGLWSQHIGSGRKSHVASETSFCFGESLGLLCESRHHFAKLGG